MIGYGVVCSRHWSMARKRAYASDFVEPDLRGTALGVFHTMIGIATLPASVIAGMLWEYDPSVTFVYGAAIGFLAAGLFVIAGRIEQRSI
jgi:MFS family permease